MDDVIHVSCVPGRPMPHALRYSTVTAQPTHTLPLIVDRHRPYIDEDVFVKLRLECFKAWSSDKFEEILQK